MSEPDSNFSVGVLLFQQSRLAEAERVCMDILQREPKNFDALHLLGVIALQTGQVEHGVELIGTAVELNANLPDAYNSLGFGFRILKRYDDALASYDKAIALKSDFAEAHCYRGNALVDLKRHEEAVASFDMAITLKPDYAQAYGNRGTAQLELRRPEEALLDFEVAISLNPGYAIAYNNRGNALRLLERPDEALTSYDKAIALQPDYADALRSRGDVLLDLKRPEEAVASYDAAIALRSDFARAYGNRGNALRVLERYEDALNSYDNAIELQSDLFDIFCDRGNMFLDLRRLEEAVASYDMAISLNPVSAEAFANRGMAWRLLGRVEAALVDHDRALAIAPDLAAAHFGRCMAELPIVYDDMTEIAVRRSAYENRLRELCRADGRFASAIGTSQPFFLAYQEQNDRDLQELHGSFVCRIAREHYPPTKLALPPKANDVIRVGVVSGFFRNHSNWKVPIKGWLTQLNRQKFQIFGYHTGGRPDAVTEEASDLCDRFVRKPLSIDGWCAEIEADSLHVLIYPEIGMDPVAAALAARRLAPIQCASWGHPDTSGFPTIDYFLSSDLMEPSDAEAHYSERLIRLPNLSLYLEPPELPEVSIVRGDLGLQSTATIYWCGQSLSKFLPKFDDVFPRIAREAGAREARDCQFVFIRYQYGDFVTKLFRNRLNKAFAAHGLNADEHCVFLPRLDQSGFAAATGLCDVFLDTIGWSGCNSTLESLPFDLPIVTIPGPLMRGRHSTAILRMMGVSETIAETIEEYVSIAGRLAYDTPWRQAIRAKVSAGKHRIYRDKDCILALEQFLAHAAQSG